METKTIRYNLKDRGRLHTGQPRNFSPREMKALVDSINSPACQEMVESRGMVGFYGHMPRVRYGLPPAEGGIENGRYAPVEPAIITTYLKADKEGNVEHRAEFLDTTSGKLAQKLFDSKAGGFSSAIDGNLSNPKFYGFDYVLAPNYVANSFRGMQLDDCFSGHLPALVTLDDIFNAEKEEATASLIMMLDSYNVLKRNTAEVIDKLSADNEELLSLLAKQGVVNPILDAAGISPVSISVNGANRLMLDCARFREEERLPQVVEPPSEWESASREETRLTNRLLRRFG